LVTEDTIPSFIGYRHAEVEEAARRYGLTLCCIDAAPPQWLAARREARVGRQRLRNDGTLELLSVLVPMLIDE